MDLTPSSTDRSSSRAARTTESDGLRSRPPGLWMSLSMGTFLMPRNHWRLKINHARGPKAARIRKILRGSARGQQFCSRSTVLHTGSETTKLESLLWGQTHFLLTLAFLFRRSEHRTARLGIEREKPVG